SVSLKLPVLGVTRNRAGAAGQPADADDGAVDNQAVERLEEASEDAVEEEADDDPLIERIGVVAVLEQAVDRRQGALQVLSGDRAGRVDAPGETDAAQRDDGRNDRNP